MPREMKQILFVVRVWYYFSSVFGLLNNIQNIFPVKTFFIHLVACSENQNVTFYFIQIPSFLIYHPLSILQI